MTLIDTEPDPTEETTYGYCAHCECNVQTVRADYGHGYCFGSICACHEDWREVCQKCESEVGEARGEEEEV